MASSSAPGGGRSLDVAALDQQEFVGRGLVAARRVGRSDLFTGDRIDQLVLEAVTGAAVHLPE